MSRKPISPAPYTRRLLQVYAQATRRDVAEGIRWYATARREIDTVARATGIDADTVAAVVAVLSPRMPWRHNVDAAATLIRQYRDGVDVENATAIMALHANIRKGYRILQGDRSALRGPKVTAFYLNLIGDPDAVTVDVWAYRAATGRDLDGNAPGIREHRAIARAHENAARRVGLTPAEFQAVAWTVIRKVWRG